MVNVLEDEGIFRNNIEYMIADITAMNNANKPIGLAIGLSFSYTNRITPERDIAKPTKFSLEIRSCSKKNANKGVKIGIVLKITEEIVGDTNFKP